MPALTHTDSPLSQSLFPLPCLQIVRDPRTHKSKGFGFVSFLDSADFAKALREMQVGRSEGEEGKGRGGGLPGAVDSQGG